MTIRFKLSFETGTWNPTAPINSPVKTIPMLSSLIRSAIMKITKHSSDVAIIRDINEVPVADIPAGNVIKDLVDLHEYAIFSSNIYEKNDEDKLPVPSGWKEYKQVSELPAAPKWNHRIYGLGFEVWVKTRPSSTPLALIVFRGTDAEQTGDWVSNFRWVTRFIPFIWDQYDQTRALVPDLVGQIRREFAEAVETAATGHSLGGGLAQQAGYVSKYVKTVYTFDASPVTGYYSVPKIERDKNEIAMRIYRVYEHGEILAYLRLLMKALYPITHKDPKIVEIKYNLTKGENVVAQHSMRKLAQKLRDIAADGVEANSRFAGVSAGASS